MIQNILMALAALAFALNSHAASFDCRKAATFVEKTICSDDQLSRLDELLMNSYQTTLVNSSDQGAVKALQRSWLANVRNACQDAACLKRVYEERLTALKKRAISDTPAASSVTGTYKTLGGELRVQQLPSGRIKFQVFASYKMNTGEASGEVPLNGDTATYVNREDDCGLVMKFAASMATVTQSGTCGMGLNVQAGGRYTLANKNPPKLD